MSILLKRNYDARTWLDTAVHASDLFAAKEDIEMYGCLHLHTNSMEGSVIMFYMHV